MKKKSKVLGFRATNDQQKMLDKLVKDAGGGTLTSVIWGVLTEATAIKEMTEALKERLNDLEQNIFIVNVDKGVKAEVQANSFKEAVEGIANKYPKLRRYIMENNVQQKKKITNLKK